MSVRCYYRLCGTVWIGIEPTEDYAAKEVLTSVIDALGIVDACVIDSFKEEMFPDVDWSQVRVVNPWDQLDTRELFECLAEVEECDEELEDE